MAHFEQHESTFRFPSRVAQALTSRIRKPLTLINCQSRENIIMEEKLCT